MCKKQLTRLTQVYEWTKWLFAMSFFSKTSKKLGAIATDYHPPVVMHSHLVAPKKRAVCSVVSDDLYC